MMISIPPCIYAVCPEDGIAENEPPLGDGYWDVFNSGCDSDDPVFQELLMPSGQDEFTFCGSTLLLSCLFACATVNGDEVPLRLP